MKTIFYKKSEKDVATYWFDNEPFVVWFTLDNILYDDTGAMKYIIDDNHKLHRLTLIEIKDQFIDGTIIRRIALLHQT